MKIQTQIPVIQLIIISLVLWSNPVLCDPQTTFLDMGCSPYSATSLSADLLANLNATLADLRRQLAGSNKTGFATAQHFLSTQIYGMAQCRDYLSTADCLACFDTAALRLKNCTTALGGRVMFDGCFLRYERNYFFDETIAQGNVVRCGNKTVTGDDNSFEVATKKLLTNLVTATPQIQGYFAAVKEKMTGSSDGSVYAVAQCTHTVSENGCRDCLSTAYQNIDAGCIPEADGRAVDVGCFLRYSSTSFFGENQTTSITPYVKTESSRNNKRAIIIGGAAGAVGFLLLVNAFVVFIIVSKKMKQVDKVDMVGVTELRGPVSFSYKDLEKSTNDFSPKNKLGQGGFGTVYKGILRNGKTVAVKKLTIGRSARAKADFASEVTLISNVHHRNVVRLLGCCSKGPELLLVYEFMANSSLDRSLFGEKQGSLNWKQRFNIIVGMARGLAYLHEEFHVCIIHRDIKSANILLDNDFQPKIADFGLVRFRPGDQSHLTTGFAGTLGYTSPEYVIRGQLSEKVDTYSYGVVVLEIISGRRSNDLKREPETQYLLEGAWKLYEKQQLLNLVDESLDPEEYDADEVKKIIEIALLCTQSSPALRPKMSEVVVMLLSKEHPEVRPSRPVFIDASNRVRGDASSSNGSSASIATASTTKVSGR